MKIIEALNVNHAVAQALPYLIKEGEYETSRNGTVIVAPTPVVTIYKNPRQRVLFSPTRDANPFFHLMESLWMLAGRCDVAFPATFNKRFKEYSDDGAIIHGAYGHRWRVLFGMDQIKHIVDELKENPNSRRAVLQMWSALGDLVSMEVSSDKSSKEKQFIGGLKSKDIPCNTHAYFDRRYGQLNMTVSCRSNDAIWGAYGANAVHFSILQEYIAAQVGVPTGVYRQVSNNFHVYTDVYSVEKLEEIAEEASKTNYYIQNTADQGVVVTPYPLVTSPIESWNDELRRFVSNPTSQAPYTDSFFQHVAVPMFKAYIERKSGISNGIQHVDTIKAEDWHLACTQWIANREKGN